MSSSREALSAAFARVLNTRLKVDERDHRVIRVAGDGYRVASVSPHMNDPEIYSRLFAAAPGLYAFAEMVAAGNTEIADLEVMARKLISLTLSEITPGRADYEADLARRPLYHDGTPRKTWDQLGDLERWSWERGALGQDSEPDCNTEPPRIR